MKRTMKGLTIQCSCCQDWGQGGISTMFRAGPTGSIEGEGFAYAFLKNFYEEGKRLPYKRNWMIKGKGPDEMSLPMTITLGDEEEEDEWAITNEEEPEKVQIEPVTDSDAVEMEEYADQTSFMHRYARGNKVLERTTVETGVTMIEGDLDRIRRNLADINDETLTRFSQPGPEEGSPMTSTQVPGGENADRTAIFQTEEEAIEKRNANQNVMDLKEQLDLLENYLPEVRESGDMSELTKCMNQIMNIKKTYSELMGGLGIYGSPNKSLTGEGENRREDNRENGEESDTGERSPNNRE